MTEVAINRLSSLAPASASAEALARLGDWVSAASQAHTLVAPLVNSAFVPEAYRPRVAANASEEEIAAATAVAVANATAAVLLGLGIGVDPLTSLQQIIIIKGRPGMYAKFKVALLLARGYDVWDDELTDESATVAGVRPGEDRVHRVTITMAQARKAGWTSNEAYAKTPQDMLWARAAGRLCDRIGANVLLGIPSAEDIPDEPLRVDARVGRVTADAILTGEPSTARTSRRRAAKGTPAEATPGSDATGSSRLPPAGDDGQLPPAPEAMKRMFSMLRDSGRADKDAALEFIRAQVGRSVISRAELTAVEVAAVIDALEPCDGSPPAENGAELAAPTR